MKSTGLGQNYLLTGSTAIEDGLVFAPVLSISARDIVLRLNTSILAHAESTQYRLLAIQSTAISAKKCNSITLELH